MLLHWILSSHASYADQQLASDTASNINYLYFGTTESSNNFSALCCLGVLEKYIDNKWREIDGADRFKITKIEGQVRRG